VAFVSLVVTHYPLLLSLYQCAGCPAGLHKIQEPNFDALPIAAVKSALDPLE
jgi:hypothetical protein